MQAKKQVVGCYSACTGKCLRLQGGWQYRQEVLKTPFLVQGGVKVHRVERSSMFVRRAIRCSSICNHTLYERSETCPWLVEAVTAWLV